MAEEKGDKNTEISDGDKKLDALCDMIKDACAKMDEGGKRMDARMDAMEDNFRRVDARMDAEEEKKEEAKADAKADAEEEKKEEAKADRKDAEEEKGEPKEPVADKRKDAEEEKKEEAKADRKDAAKKDEEEKKEEAHADAAPISRAEAAALRQQIADLQVRAPAIISDSDRERFALIQEQADPVFQAFNDRAPSPLDGETPTQYKRRLGGKLQAHSPKWKDSRLSAVSDEGMLDTILADVYADSMAAARKGVDVPRGQLRMITRQSGGHTINEFEGDADSWMNPFAGHSQRATGDWRRPH